jgi:hypothetical protein
VIIIECNHPRFCCIVYVIRIATDLQPLDLCVREYFVVVITTIRYHCIYVILGFPPIIIFQGYLLYFLCNVSMQYV